VNERTRRRRHLVDGVIERGLVDAGWPRGSTEFANELEGGCANLIVRGWRVEVRERFDIPAHLSSLLLSGFLNEKVSLPEWIAFLLDPKNICRSRRGA
jgi:hypothetical protein